MDDRNKTIDKINKLLQLAAKNPNSSEAQIAQTQAEAAYQQQQTAADNTSTKFAFGFIAVIGFTLLVLAYIFPTQAKIIMAIGVLMLLVTYWHIALAIGFLYVIFTYF